MKVFFVFSFLIFGLNAEAGFWETWRWPWEREDLGPLREIRISGSYTPEDERELEEDEGYYRKRGWLEEGESFKDSSLYVGQGKERFESPQRLYCHKKTDPEEKDEVIFNPNLRSRLYDEEGNVLTEDYLRSYKYQPTHFIWPVKAYVPYHPEAQKQRVVRLEGDKEIVLWERGVSTLEDFRSGKVWMAYSNRSDCYY